MLESAVVWNGIKEWALGMRKMMMELRAALLTLVVTCVEGCQSVG